MKEALKLLVAAGEHKNRMKLIEEEALRAYQEAKLIMWRQWLEVCELQKTWSNMSLAELQQLKTTLKKLDWADFKYDEEIYFMDELELLIIAKEKDAAYGPQ